MIWIANALVALVAALHVDFLVLEMFLWTKPLGLKTFHQNRSKGHRFGGARRQSGLYNGFLAAGLAWGLVHGIRPSHSRSRWSVCSTSSSPKFAAP